MVCNKFVDAKPYHINFMHPRRHHPRKLILGLSKVTWPEP